MEPGGLSISETIRKKRYYVEMFHTIQLSKYNNCRERKYPASNTSLFDSVFGTRVSLLFFYLSNFFCL
jgi:hypothetical protein